DRPVGQAAALGGVDVVVAGATEELVSPGVEQRPEAVVATLPAQHVVTPRADQLVVAAAAGDDVVAAAAVDLDPGADDARDRDPVRTALGVDVDQGVPWRDAAGVRLAGGLTPRDRDPGRVRDDEGAHGREVVDGDLVRSAGAADHDLGSK